MNIASALGNGTEGRARWSLRLFGGFELNLLPGGERVAQLGKRERVLLAYLALSPNYRQPRRKLVTLLWGDAADETTLDNLRNCLWNLRKALGDTEHRVVASDGEDIVLDVAAFDVDALAFRRLAAQSGRTEREEAAELYPGVFLDGLLIESEEFESWHRAEASRYRDLAIDVLTRLMTQLSECGETERAIAMGERTLRLEPLHEAAVRRLMRHYSGCGRRAAAIQLYRTFADTLRTELDAQPEAETRAVFAEIARGEEQTSAPAAADNELRPRSTTMARPGDAPSKPLRPPTWPSLRLRAPLTVLAAVLLVATALVSYRQFVPLGAQPGVVTEGAAAADSASAISIAVLPFLNLSGDAGQEFFSDGMTEEITSALAMVPDLKVVARTSAFQFKGEKNDMRAVGQALNATHLVEGSVRRVGDRVRITAQLIEAGKGTHLWSETYDRQLSDIFATQEEIARTVVGSLMAPLGLAPGENLVSNRAIDLESYDQYLRAKGMVRARGLPNLTSAAPLLEQVVAHNPDFAPAWALLAEAHAHTVGYQPAVARGNFEELRRVVDASIPKAETAAQRAIQLDPDLADGYSSLGGVRMQGGKQAMAEDLLKKALALDPYNPNALEIYAYMLGGVGRLKEALAMMQRLQELDGRGMIAELLWLNGRNDEAIARFKDQGGPGRGLTMIYSSMGRYSEAADFLHSRNPEQVSDPERLLRTAPAKAASPEGLPRLELFGFVYLHVGAPDRVLEWYEGLVGAGYVQHFTIAWLWHPSNAAVRKTERFKAFVRKAGLVDYWRERGWPEFCRPTGADDFVCV